MPRCATCPLVAALVVCVACGNEPHGDGTHALAGMGAMDRGVSGASGGMSGSGASAGRSASAPGGGGSGGAAAAAAGSDALARATDGTALGPVTEGGCGSPGWREVDVAWNELGYGVVRDGGFHYCYPPGWSEADRGGLRYDEPGTGKWALVGVGGFVDLSHERTLQRLRDTWPCTEAANHARQYVAIGGWPALQQTYVGQQPVCGACPRPAAPEAVYSVFTDVATGDYYVSMQGMSNTSLVYPAIADMLAIGRTITADNVGAITAAQLDDELTALRADAGAPCVVPEPMPR